MASRSDTGRRRKGRRQENSRRLRWPSTAGKQIAAVVGLASGVVALASGVFGLVEKVQGPPAPDPWVRLEPLSVEPMTFRDALLRQDFSTAGYTPERLACPVALVGARVTASGYAGAVLPVRWYLVRADGRFVSASRGERELRPTDDRREFEYPLMVRLPVRGGRFYAEVRVVDRDGFVSLAKGRTALFSGPRSAGAADCDVT